MRETVTEKVTITMTPNNSDIHIPDTLSWWIR